MPFAFDHLQVTIPYEVLRMCYSWCNVFDIDSLGDLSWSSHSMIVPALYHWKIQQIVTSFDAHLSNNRGKKKNVVKCCTYRVHVFITAIAATVHQSSSWDWHQHFFCRASTLKKRAGVYCRGFQIVLSTWQLHGAFIRLWRHVTDLRSTSLAASPFTDEKPRWREKLSRHCVLAVQEGRMRGKAMHPISYKLQ